jgi:hypothetical protein
MSQSQINSKIVYLQKIEKILNINHFDIDYDKHNDLLDDIYKDVDNILLFSYRRTFPKTTRKTPIESKRDLFDILANGYNSIVTGLFIPIEGKLTYINKKRVRLPTTYKLNVTLLTKHLELIQKKDNNLTKVDDNILSLVGIKRGNKNKEYAFNDTVIDPITESYNK